MGSRLISQDQIVIERGGQHSDDRSHKRELENIKRMRELRDKGFSYEKIASVFNSMKIPTKTRKGKWHRKTVQSIWIET